MGTVELGTTELVLGLVAAITTMTGVLAAMTRWFASQLEQAKAQQDAERQRDEKRLEDENEALRREVQELRFTQTKQAAERQKDRALLESNEREIAEMRGQIGTLLTEMGVLQGQVKKLTEERDNERDEKERVRQERDELLDALREKTEQCKAHAAQIAAYRDALALVRGEPTDADASPEPGEGAGPGHKEE